MLFHILRLAIIASAFCFRASKSISSPRLYLLSRLAPHTLSSQEFFHHALTGVLRFLCSDGRNGIPLQIIAGGPHLHPGQIARRPGQTLQALNDLFMRQRQVAVLMSANSCSRIPVASRRGEFPSNSCGQNAFRVMMACSGGSRRR